MYKQLALVQELIVAAKRLLETCDEKDVAVSETNPFDVPEVVLDSDNVSQSKEDDRDHDEVELRLFIDNDGHLYNSRHLPIMRNLMGKRKKGVYDHDLAVKSFMYLVDDGAKKYVKDLGLVSAWQEVFPMTTRKRVAEDMASSFEEAADTGEYDNL